MTEKYRATLIDHDGTRVEYISTDLSHDVMFPIRGGELLYLSRISYIKVLEEDTVPGSWQALATLAFTGRPFAAGLASLVYEKTTCLAEIGFYGDKESYLLLTNERVCEKVQRIHQNIRFYGSYKEHFPGTFGRIMNIGSYYVNFWTTLLTLLMIGMLCLTGFLILLLTIWLTK